MRAGLLVLCGMLVGAGSAALLFNNQEQGSSAVVTPPPERLSCESELHQQRERIADLERRVAAAVSSATEPRDPPEALAALPSDPAVKEGQCDTAVKWRVSAIAKFVELTDEQKEQLEQKYREEKEAREEGRESQAETLEAIIGQEKASEYRQQVQAAFARVQNEELDKESVWIARKLSLSSDQERSMRVVFADVEAQIESEFGDATQGVSISPQQRVTRMIAENKRRLELRSAALQKILSPEQHTAYVQTEAQSSSADVEVFHGP
jgi:hypothetical protein